MGGHVLTKSSETRTKLRPLQTPSVDNRRFWLSDVARKGGRTALPTNSWTVEES